MKILRNILFLFSSIAFLWIAGFSAFSAFTIFAKPQAQTTRTDAIIVLTGGGQRIDEGLALFARRQSKNLFISGVHKDVIKNDIIGIWQGPDDLPPCCITLGYKATTTEENATEVREWIAINKIKSIRLVTGNYHMPRSLLEFYHKIPGIVIYAHPVKQLELTIENRDFWNLLVLEYHKTLYRSLQLIFSP